MEEKEKEALKLTIEEWTWLRETGLTKHSWPGWKDKGGPHEDCLFGCFLCQYVLDAHFPDTSTVEFSYHYRELCEKCPYGQKFGSCMKNASYVQQWEDTVKEATKERKRLAGLIVSQLKELESA